MSDSRHVHWVASKHVLRYLHGMVRYGLRYTSIRGVRLFGYIDSDWAGSAVDQKSTSSYCFSMGSVMISWSSRKHSSMALTTAKAEYIAANDANKESIWLPKLLVGLFREVLETTIIHCANQSYVKLSENPVYHDRSKHIEMWYYYLQDMFQKGAIRLQYILTDEQIADVFTKPLSTTKFVYF